jgi:signal peptidase I
VASICPTASAAVLVLVLGVPAAAAPGTTGPFKTYRVATASMEPTLACSGGSGCSRLQADQVVVRRLGLREPVRRGELVVFQHAASSGRTCSGRGPFIKRVIGLPNEVVSQRRGIVYTNGLQLAEPYLARRHPGGDFRSARLGRGEYFVMGDNRARSCDSRTFGPVARDDIWATVVAVKRG